MSVAHLKAVVIGCLLLLYLVVIEGVSYVLKWRWSARHGDPCRAWAIRGTDRCAAHSGRCGAPPGNRNAQKHGWYAQPARPIEGIDDAVEDLQRRLTQVAALMDETDDPEFLLDVFKLYAQGTSRYGRLLRDQRALSGESADSLLEALSQAVDEIGTELGIDLGGN